MPKPKKQKKEPTIIRWVTIDGKLHNMDEMSEAQQDEIGQKLSEQMAIAYARSMGYEVEVDNKDTGTV